MGWSQRFRDALEEPVLHPRYILESVACGEYRAFEGQLKLSSFPAAGYTSALTLEGCAVTWPRLTPGSWRRTHGTLRVGILGSEDIRTRTARGQVVVLRMGFSGWAPDEFEAVWVGQVRSLQRRGHLWLLSCVDLVGALTSRFTSTASQGPLFHSLGDTTTTTAYTPGVSTSITVSSTTGFAESSAGGGEGYLVELTPDTGEPFYIRATTLVGSTFSGLTANIFGTAWASASSGNRIRCVAYSESHPLNLARRILTSTGTSAANGSRDVLPANWSYGIPRHLVAEDDIEAWVSLIAPSSGSDDWALLEAEEQSSGLAWLEAFLGAGGLFLGMHQGQITARGIISPLGSPTPETIGITDRDIASIDDYQTWSPDVPVEYRSVRATASDGGSDTDTESTITTRPVLTRYDYDLADVWDNGSAWCSERVDALGPYLMRVPEVVALTCRGWRTGRASLGEALTLETRHLHSRVQHLGDDFDGRRCLHVGGGPNFFGASSQLELLFLPTVSTEA